MNDMRETNSDGKDSMYPIFWEGQVGTHRAGEPVTPVLERSQN